MIDVGVVGSSGYTGLELLRILSQHPEINKILITAGRSKKDQMDDIVRHLIGKNTLFSCELNSREFDKCDVVFFATPHGVAIENAEHLINKGIKVIDLSADFRLKDSSDFKKWYGKEHTKKKLLKEAVYGLPEIYRKEIKNARLVAMPGCYPTAVILGFLPLLLGNHIDVGNLIADCKSGVSGAGKTPKSSTMFSETSENFMPYGLTGHRHWPEIYQELNSIISNSKTTQNPSSNSLGILFCPHLVPMIRGIETTLYCKLNELSQGNDIQKLYEETYALEPFVEILSEGVNPETSSVRGLNTAKIAITRPEYNKNSDSKYLVIT